MTIIIVGGGYSGLHLAKLIGDGALLFEEHKNIGIPEHCAGIISPKTFKIIGCPRNLIEEYYNELRIYTGHGIISWIGNPLAIKINRIALEKYLYHEALSNGAKIILGSRVEEVNFNGKVKVKNTFYKGDIIVIAEGAKRFFSRKLGLTSKCNAFHGLQVRLKAKCNIKEIEVYLTNLAEKFFAWLIPIPSNNQAIIGLASKSTLNLNLKLNRLVNLLEKHGKIKVYQFINYFGGLILTGPVGKISIGNIIGIGDSIQMNKPLTGGGLYPITISNKILAKNLNMTLNGEINFNEAVKAYESEVKFLIKKLRNSYYLAKLIRNTDYELLKIIAKGSMKINLHKKILGELDYDDHYTSLIKSIFKPNNLMNYFASLLLGLI